MRESENTAIPARLEGQVALVTGGGSGIGRAVCLTLAAAGAAAVAVDIDGESARDVVREIGAGRSSAIEADISDPHAVTALVDEVGDRYGRIDVLVNNAGICPVEPLLDVELGSWRRVFSVNVEGPLLMTLAVARRMRGQGTHEETACRGKIINVSSPAAEVGRPNLPAYGASKAALNHLAMSSAAALAESAIATTVIYPGNVADGMWSTLPGQLAALEGASKDEVIRARLAASPLGRFQSATEVAESILFVAARPGLELNGKVLWTFAHAENL